MNTSPNNVSSEQLWQQLQQHALVADERPHRHPALTPWYVRVMLGIAGWIGAMFLLGFVGVGFAFVMKNMVAAMLVGVLCCGAAYGIFRVAREHDFGMQFGLALSLAGQGLFIFGLISLFDGFGSQASLLYFGVVVFEATLALLVPNFIHRVLSSAAAAYALSLALSSLGLYGMPAGVVAAGLALIWSDPQRWLVSVWRPVGYGLALALLQIESTRLFGLSSIMWTATTGISWWTQYGWWVSTALVTAVLLWSVTRMLAQQQIALASSTGMAALIAVLAVGTLSLRAPGLATALLILLLGFAAGNRILLGLGIFALLGFISHYYYQMQSTLLVKAMVLAASGGILLCMRLALHKLYPMTVEQESDHA